MKRLEFVYSSSFWRTFELFKFLAIMNKAALNIIEQIFVWAFIFISAGNNTLE